jgi:ABC-type glycerol-3-phosphate transport system substrate-binding protein
MKHRKWTIALLGGLLILSLVLTACGAEETPEPTEPPAAAEEPTKAPAEAPAEEPVAVTYWHTMSDAEVEAM